MSDIKSVFARDIEENIAPVIYFHQIEPETALKEVREYVFTTRDTNNGQALGGIHEQMVALIEKITEAVKEGHKNPASWISGFFGSGKSSFAKLLGLALDKMPLPDGSIMDQALIERDDTGKGQELQTAFDRLYQLIDPMAVIFDIGTAAKNNESIPHTVYREILTKLGYSKHDGVSHFEQALEEEGRLEEFEELYFQQYNKQWSDHKNSALAPLQFRAIYMKLFPEQAQLTEISTFSLQSITIQTLVSNIQIAMKRRASGKTIFIVVDEVSQYIARDQNKMLDLQSFVMEIGGKNQANHAPLWLLVTGQEKLEEETKESVLFKLKDRFPPELRVHLDRSNVQEVVSRRLLKKKAASGLENLFTDSNIDTLKLSAFECENTSQEALIENYPLLPGHIALFMDITQNIRNNSSRTQTDAGGVRSVLNNIWDLFNREPVALKNKPLGTLMTLDMLYDIIGSSIDSDVQLTLNKIFQKYPSDSMESKVVKSIALLEMNGEHESVQPKLLASLLYPNLGASSVNTEVEKALENLQKDNWIHFHEKNGYHIQNNAAQEWNRTKKDISIPPGKIIEIALEIQKDLVGNTAIPNLDGSRFPIESYWGSLQKISGRQDPTQVRVNFYWEPTQSKRSDLTAWTNKSRQEAKIFHWLSGDTSNVESQIREYERSQRMIMRYQSQGQLQHIQQQLLYREQADSERLKDAIIKDLKQVWLSGEIFFNGASIGISSLGTSFENTLKTAIENNLKTLFHKFSQGHIRITESEFKQILERDTSGLSLIFFNEPQSLGIAQNDNGNIVFNCQGPVPTDIYQYLTSKTYQTGAQLLDYFGAAPYGYSSVVVRSSIVGLLRSEKIKLSTNSANNTAITSIQDPGATSTFENIRDFKQCEIEINKDVSLTARDRTKLAKFFESHMGCTDVARESDVIADLIAKLFPTLKDDIVSLKHKLNSLEIQTPVELEALIQSLSACIGERQVQELLKRFKSHYDTIEKGITRYQEIVGILNEPTEKILRDLLKAKNEYYGQLLDVDEAKPVEAHYDELDNHFKGRNPWRAFANVIPDARSIETAYDKLRAHYIQELNSAVDEAKEKIKLRDGYSDLDSDQMHEVTRIIEVCRRAFQVDATQPSLLVIHQSHSQVTEAFAQAQKKFDQFINENAPSQPTIPDSSGVTPPPKPRIHVVKHNLQNKVIKTEIELDRLIAELRTKCLKEINNGIQVRLEQR